MENALQVNPPGYLTDQDWSHPLGAQLFVNTQEVDLYHLLLSEKEKKNKNKKPSDEAFNRKVIPASMGRHPLGTGALGTSVCSATTCARQSALRLLPTAPLHQAGSRSPLNTDSTSKGERDSSKLPYLKALPVPL